MRAQWITAAVVALALCATTTACDESEKDAPTDDDGASRRASKKRKKRGRRAPSDAWEKGGEVAVQLTLSAADVTDFACAMKKDIGKLSCAYTAPDEEASATDLQRSVGYAAGVSLVHAATTAFSNRSR